MNRYRQVRAQNRSKQVAQQYMQSRRNMMQQSSRTRTAPGYVATRSASRAPSQTYSVDTYFDKVFILNMDKRPDRWHNMKRRLAKQGITNYERWTGIDGYASPHREEYEAYSRTPKTPREKSMGRKMISSPGVWGILKSMKRLFVHARQQKYRRILVLQDDALFHHKFKQNFQKVGKIGKWRMLYLGVTQWSFSPAMLKATDYYYPLGKADGAFAVGYDQSIYNFIIREIEKMNNSFDSGPLMTVQKSFPRECYVISPFLTIADVNESDCRGGRSQREMAQKVKWNLPNYTEHTRVSAEPIVSVVIVSHNNARSIVHSLDSLGRQTYSKLDIIIVDRGSTDSTVGLIEAVSVKDKRIRLIPLEANRAGAATAKNMGILLAKGELITFQEPTDLSHTTRIEEQVKVVRQTNQACTCANRYVAGQAVQDPQTLMFSRHVLLEYGYLKCISQGAEYEYLNRLRAKGVTVTAYPDVLVMQHATMTEGGKPVADAVGGSTELDKELKDIIDAYHQKIGGNGKTDYMTFPPKKRFLPANNIHEEEVDVEYVVDVVNNA